MLLSFSDGEMNIYYYIISKQVQWALNRGIGLIGSEGKRGAPAYTQELSQNLFEPLLPYVEESFREGNGGEIEGRLISQQRCRQYIHHQHWV
jgi:hypothetical protein